MPLRSTSRRQQQLSSLASTTASRLSLFFLLAPSILQQQQQQQQQQQPVHQVEAWTTTPSSLSSFSRTSATATTPLLRGTSPFSLLSSSNIHQQQVVSSIIIRRRMSTTSSSESVVDIIPGRPTWQQTMLRIRDPKKSVAFYESLGMTLIDTFDFPQYKFSLYFMTTLPDDAPEYKLKPGTKEAHDYLWSMEGVALELTHNHGTENDDSFTGYHPGNQEKDGFGHIAVNVADVYATCDKLEKAGHTFKKKPDEGRMKGLAFVYDPDGYWVEICKRDDDCPLKCEYNFSQTMIRVKDPEKSIAFYGALGMNVLVKKHYDDFSIYYLGSSNVPKDANPKTMLAPVLELTHNHGTEKDDSFQHYNGNEKGKEGFGHTGFLVDDVYKACDALRPYGYGFRKEPDGGSMKGLAFAYDPDGYSIEIIKRGGIEFGDVKKE